ncbi:MAG: glycosyltransferase family 4 protein [Coriobacteriia bacterium]
MRILYVHQFFATRESSLGLIRSYEFARRWVEQGHDVTIVTSSSRLPSEFSRKIFVDGYVDGIRVRSVRIDYSNYMGYARRIWSFLLFTFGGTLRAITSGRHDIVFATSTPLTVGIPGVLTAFLMRAPFVFEVRDLWPEAAIQMGALRPNGLLARGAKVLEQWLYRRAAAVVALSPGMVEGVIALCAPEQGVHMIPNCSDLELFQPGPKDPDLVARYDLDGLLVVGYTGAIGPSNAVEDHVPEAARILHESGRTDVVFLIAGDGKSLPTLRERTAGLPNVRLVGAVPKREVPKFTRTADVLMTLFADVPVLATNSPNKFFDALASGRPVIVNQPGWTRDLVLDNEIGAAITAGDGEALARVIIDLADDPERRARMGRNARELAEREFDRDDMDDRLLGILSDVVDAHHDGTR